MPLYEEKIISPLAIRFGQSRIRSTFKDGHTLEESLAQIFPVAPPEGSNHDFLLHTPFPPIEVVRWRPKLRGDDGVALESASGETLHGEECWFTLDNRRLYCLQRAAVRLLSQGCAACVVRIMYDIPTVKSIARKFKTTTSGSRVRVDNHRDQAPLFIWEWESLKHVKTLRAAGDCEALAQVKADKATRDLYLLVDAPDEIDVPENALGTKIESDPEELLGSDDADDSEGSVNKQEYQQEEQQTMTHEQVQQLRNFQMRQQKLQQQHAQLVRMRLLQQQLMAQQWSDIATQQMWHMQLPAAQIQRAMQWEMYCRSMQQHGQQGMTVQQLAQHFMGETRSARP